MKTKTPIHKYTLVQHTGFAVGGNPQFQQAVEEACLTTNAEVDRAQKAGGLVFDDYSQASDRAEQENYPPTVTGLIPKAAGSFARVAVDGLRIYLPPAQKNTDVCKATITLESMCNLSDTELDAVEEALEEIHFSGIVKKALEKRLGAKAHKIITVVRNG